MKIYFLNNQENILLNYPKFAADLKAKAQLTAEPTVKFIATAQTPVDQLAVTADDVVVLGFGHYFDLDFVQDQLPQQVAFFEKQGAQIVLTTELRRFNVNETYFDKSTDDLAIYQLAFDHRLKVLDVYSFLNSWYQRVSVDERRVNLDAVAENRYQVQATQLTAMLTPWVANWMTRQLFHDQFMQDYSYGACMYPEAWDDATNETDMAHAEKIGMNTVRIGEFFWDKLEPQEDYYTMDYLVDLLTKYRNHGLKVILGIPSPTPPRWFTVHYPEARLVNVNGQAEEHGSRQHVCTNNPIFRRKVYQLTHEIAKVAAQFDNVIGIQIDNEFKCHVDQCFCPTCRQLWPRWLRAKYQTIDQLNAAWGTDIWSERYPDFESVVLPTKTPFAHNSGLDNAFRMFTADTVNDFCAGIAQILIAETDIPITHNTSLNFNLINYELFSQLDVVGFDTYPMYNQYWNFPINLDLWRNLKNGTEVLLLETATSHVGYTGNYVTPHPHGYLPTEIFIGYAAGLKAFTYWPFRAQPNGVEQTHSAVVTQVGTPDLGYADVLKGQQLLEKYRPFLDQTEVTRSKVALVYSDNAKREMHVETGGIYEYRKNITEVYRAFTTRGIAIEMVPENVDFNQFDCVMIPYVRNVNEHLLAKMKAFANAGGHLIIGPMTGDRTADMGWIRGHNGLGRIGEWLGVENEIQYLSEDETTRARVKVGDQQDEFGGLVTLFDTDKVMDNVTTEAPVADTRSIIYKNKNVMYLGGMPKDSVNSPLWDELIDQFVKPCDADHAFLDTPNGIFKYRRESDTEVQFYVANMTLQPLTYDLHQSGRDADDQPLEAGQQTLAAYQCQLVRIKKVG